MNRRNLIASAVSALGLTFLLPKFTTAKKLEDFNIPRLDWCMGSLKDYNLTDEEICDPRFVFVFECKGKCTDILSPYAKHPYYKTGALWIDNINLDSRHMSKVEFINMVKHGFATCYKGYKNGDDAKVRRYYIGDRTS